jgi:hypothetical protein
VIGLCSRGWLHAGQRQHRFRSRHGWEIAVFARNLFDRNYIQNVAIQAGMPD